MLLATNNSDMEPNSSSTGDDRLPCMDMDSTTRGLLPWPCNEGSVKLFGVRLTSDSTMAMMMRKTVSMGNLSSYNSANVHLSTPERSESGEGPAPADPHGYISDGLVQNSGSLRERKKGVPWTEDEHRMFLVGLQKLGKGDWRGIARNFIPSRTPTQVASHAQKYFLRQNNLNKRKRRSSLFDMISSNPTPTISNTADHAGSHATTEPNLVSSTSVSADLCLGIPDEAHRGQQRSQVQKWCHKFSSQHHSTGASLGTQAPPERTRVLPLTLNFTATSARNLMRPSAAAAAMSFSSSSSAMSSSSSSSSLSSLCRIDEAPELATSLTLGIGPPVLPLLREPSAAELTLKLEQPSPTRHTAIGGTTSNSSAYASAIRVV